MRERNLYVQELTEEYLCADTDQAWATYFGLLRNVTGWGFLVSRTF
jgi:hypothetical protein